MVLFGAVVLATTSARAEGSDDAPTPEVKAPAIVQELSMGFGGAVLDPSALPLVFASGEAGGVAGATGLGAPFGGPALRALVTAGPAWESRVIRHHTRFTLGLQKTWALFRHGALDGEALATGSPLVGPPLPVGPRALSLWGLRLGLGGEATFGPVTPFVDLLGDVQFVSADVSVEGQAGTCRASDFSLSVRAGLRVRLDSSLSVGLAGEYGIAGPSRFGVTLLRGWVLPIS